MGNLIDNFAIFETKGGGTMAFDSYWAIENYWDFGFVQVSTDGGMKHKVLNMQLDGMTEFGLFELNAILKNFKQEAFLVTYDADEDTTIPTDYTYDSTLNNRRGGP